MRLDTYSRLSDCPTPATCSILNRSINNENILYFECSTHIRTPRVRNRSRSDAYADVDHSNIMSANLQIIQEKYKPHATQVPEKGAIFTCQGGPSASNACKRPQGPPAPKRSSQLSTETPGSHDEHQQPWTNCKCIIISTVQLTEGSPHAASIGTAQSLLPDASC